MIGRVRAFTEAGGHILASFRSFFADENLLIYRDRQPHGLRFVFNYSDTEQAFACPVEGRDVLTGLSYIRGQTCALGAWQLMAVREEA